MREFLPFLWEKFASEILMDVQRTRHGIAVSGETVEQIGEYEDHGKEHRHLGVRFQVSQVATRCPTSHECLCVARNKTLNGGIMPY